MPLMGTISPNQKKWLGILAASVILAGVIALAIYLLIPSSHQSGDAQRIDAIAARGPAAAFPDLPDANPADIQLAMLGDFYEHGIEHTPPRDPSGAMQKRERFYRAPTDPFV